MSSICHDRCRMTALSPARRRARGGSARLRPLPRASRGTPARAGAAGRAGYRGCARGRSRRRHRPARPAGPSGWLRTSGAACRPWTGLSCPTGR
ncbi:hypothetical protein G6F23_015852 [Rhizopus arrhizus]|nr:hypothetical protein G6F23_015852 [Rhizopus arrhizus]